MNRSTFASTASLVLLGGSVLAAPPAPTAAGIAGTTTSAAPLGGLTRDALAARPRAGAFVTSLTPDARAALPVRTPKPAEITIADTQEVVVFTTHRPVRIRLTALYQGKAVADVWRDKLRKAFDHFDRDKDGLLNGFEVQNIFSDAGLARMLQNGFYQPTPQDRPTLDRLDVDGGRTVSFDEFVAYYKTSTAQVLRPLPPVAENPFNAAATEALFKLMDANGDGKLTRDEVRAIENLIATKDADEDECLSLTELLPDLNNPRGGRAQQFQPNASAMPVARPNPAAQMVITYDAGRVPGTLTQQVIKKYDQDGDFELTRAEVGFDEPTFARLDADGDGMLDGEELDTWRTGPADFEVGLSLALKEADCVAKLATDAADLAARGFAMKQAEPGRLIVRTGRQTMEFWAYAAVGPQSQQPALKTQYAYLFTQAAGMGGFIADKDLTGPKAVQFQFIRTIFDAADADGNGKLTKSEYDGFFDLQDSFHDIALAFTPAIQTPTLFQLFDENRDGRLGVRELRTAWDRLSALEPGNSNVVTKAAIQPSVSLRLSRGMDRFSVNQSQFANQNPNQVMIPQKGPLWFRRMDRNADGDVSRSEYLGTRTEFDTMDSDRDDLISLEEAEAYDQKVRTDGKKEKTRKDAAQKD